MHGRSRSFPQYRRGASQFRRRAPFTTSTRVTTPASTSGGRPTRGSGSVPQVVGFEAGPDDRPVVESLPTVDALFERLGVDAVTHGCVADLAFVDALTDDERRSVERAVESRRGEFAGGRACAHASLAVLAVDQASIVAAADRSPVWPARAVGSITHSEGYCLAVVSAQTSVSVGIDAEGIGRVTQDVAEITMSDDERRWIASAARPEVMSTAAFAVKEALYKAQFPVTGSWLDFGDVEVSETQDAAVLRIDLVTDVTSVRHLTWPLTAHWTVIEPAPGHEMVVAAVVV